MNKQGLPGYIKTTIFLVAVYVGWQLMLLARSFLIPILLAWIIAVVLYPAQLFFEKKLRLPKGGSAFICVIIVSLFFSLFLFFLAGEASVFSADLATLNQKIPGATGQFQQYIHSSNTLLNGYFSKAINVFVGFFSSLAGGILVGFTNMLVWFVLVVVYVFFFLYYRRLLYYFVIQIFKEKNSVQVQAGVQSIRGLTNHFVLGILIEMLAVALLNCTLLSIFGIQHSIMIALLAAVLNIIPYVGIYSATLLSVLITYANSDGAAAITAAIILLSVHIVDANFLMPRIMGSQVKLNSFAALLAVVAGGIIWGIPGMFLFIPLAAIARIVFEQIPSCLPLALLLGNDKK